MFLSVSFWFHFGGISLGVFSATILTQRSSKLFAEAPTAKEQNALCVLMVYEQALRHSGVVARHLGVVAFLIILDR